MLNRFRSAETRTARRLARIARWDRPIEGGLGRLRAWANMVLVDHGVFRLAYLNLHRVTPKLWRAAQPAPPQLARLRAQGLRTVVYLRGGREHGSWQLQKECCEALGLELVDFVVRSRAAPDKETLLRARAFFEGLSYPALVHCKSGADRAGFMSALYLVVHEGRPADEALRQLSLRYGHFRFAKTGILDAFFERWRDEGEAQGLSFEEWVETRYDPDALTRAFKPGLVSDILVDRIMKRE
ncbi:fused DSP-PTPase phosphatase/NAD kinase-like protein [Salinarimonas ramus]|uniref:Protein-tyrosine-phosphatase n=1 Tax=Salinarimonas ramus TaxID=690164 RepID=A0A917QII4_9HYPH|nr:tyrosine-protein phosphatase [Salinarimonas ramus]GGK52402.1 protein-tyrosine-phosphatase [Salinarimonas ramus]